MIQNILKNQNAIESPKIRKKNLRVDPKSKWQNLSGIKMNSSKFNENIAAARTSKHLQSTN
jgi:hypothetical protein